MMAFQPGATLPATAFGLCLLLCPGPNLEAGEPVEFSAYYEARTNGMRGTAERHLVHLTDNNYRLNISLEAKLAGINIGDLKQTSELSLVDNQIVPQHYSYLISGITSGSETVSFNWDAGVALSTEDEQSWTLELEPGVLDQLSLQLSLAQQLAESTDSDSDLPQEFEFRLVDGDEIATHRYRNLGAEILQTPLGELNSVKLERIREADSGRQTLIWFAADWHYLLARIEQTNPSGLRIELALERALVAGETVSALP